MTRWRPFILISVVLGGLLACNLVSDADPTAVRQSPASTEAASSKPAASVAGDDLWRPALNTTWQWQLSPPIDDSFDVDMYDIELFDNDATLVAALHAQGRKVVCYISVGSWEDWRPDKDQFPAEIIGNDYEGWPGEKWLDIRQIELLAPIMRARLDACQAKGFEGIKPEELSELLRTLEIRPTLRKLND